MPKIIGTVNWFSTNGQSYGYIYYGEQNQNQVFFHYSQISEVGLREECYKKSKKKVYKSLQKGDVVSFDLGTGFGLTANGSQAINVEVVKLNG